MRRFLFSLATILFLIPLFIGNVSAQQSYEANLRMFDQARQMSTALFDLLRK